MNEFMVMFSELKTFLVAVNLVIPATQMLTYVVLVNLLMLFGLYRYCYMTSLAFSFYWLFIVNQRLFMQEDGSMYGGHFTYIAVGVCFLFLLGGSMANQEKK